MVLRTKPPNPRCGRVSDLPPSTTPSPSSLTRPTGLRQVPRRHRLHLDLANAVFITIYTCTYRCPKCQSPRLVTRLLGPSVQASRPPFITPSPSARHVLLNLHLAVDYRLRASHLHITSQETCTHSFRHDRVSHHLTYFVDHIDNHSSQNEHTRVLVNLVFVEIFGDHSKHILRKDHSIHWRHNKAHKQGHMFWLIFVDSCCHGHSLSKISHAFVSATYTVFIGYSMLHYRIQSS
jgi:hypothetical protein